MGKHFSSSYFELKYCGRSNLGSRAFTHFTTGDYQALGRYYCETLQDFLDSDPPNTELRSKILQKLIKVKHNIRSKSQNIFFSRIKQILKLIVLWAGGV